MPDDGFQNVAAVFARLGGDQRRVGGVQADHFLDLVLDLLRLGAGQVDLVDDRHGFQIVLQRHVYVGQRLRLDALRRVHHQQRAFAGRQCPADLIAEVHMAGGVDQVEDVSLSVLGLILHAHGLRLDGDAALPFQFHGVQNLLRHLPLLKHARHFQQAVRQRALAVVDMGNNTEIANMGQPFLVVQLLFPPSK